MGVDFRVREFLFTAVAATLIGLLCLLMYQKASGVPNFDLLNHQPREDTELVRIFFLSFIRYSYASGYQYCVIWVYTLIMRVGILISQCTDALENVKFYISSD